jgi:hypothetical protein
MEKRRKKMKANDNIWKEERKCERKKEWNIERIKGWINGERKKEKKINKERQKKESNEERKQ